MAAPRRDLRGRACQRDVGRPRSGRARQKSNITDDVLEVELRQPNPASSTSKTGIALVIGRMANPSRVAAFAIGIMGAGCPLMAVGFKWPASFERRRLRLTCVDPGITVNWGLGGFQMKMFELEDVVSLLRAEVRRVGGQAAFAKKAGIQRVDVNRALTGARLPSRSVVDALGLAPIYAFKTDLPRRRAHGRRHKG
jgi:hypothetical protein